MKANEAPEKLYVELCSDGVYAHVREWENSDNIEYTRTDAFIEKACEWLQNNAGAYMESLTKYGDGYIYNTDDLIVDFKNYMKGVENER